MAGDWLTDLTLITNFMCMAISLWFAIYLLARSPADPLTFRAVIILLALAFYYNNTFTALITYNPNSGPVRSFAVLIALVAAHSLTHYLLPPAQMKKQYWIEYGLILAGVIIIILLFTAPFTDECDPLLTCPANITYPWIVINSFKVLLFIAILYNLWQIYKNGARFQILALYGTFLLGASTIAFGLMGTIFNLEIPRFLPNLAMLSALILLLYTVARDQTFVKRRSSRSELPITLLTITVIVALYVVSAWQLRLGAVSTLLLAVLAILTHSAYDFVREFIDRMFHSEEGRLRKELRQMARDADSEEALLRFLKRGLAILCYNLRASYGLIALRKGNQYQVVASLHCLQVGSQFPAGEILSRGNSGSHIDLAGYKLWLLPAFVKTDMEVVVGMGNRKDQIPYSEDDLYWLEDIAEEIGWVISAYWVGRSNSMESHVERSPDPNNELLESLDEFDMGELLSKLAYKPDPELVKCVEESLRNLNDYSRLGKSELALRCAIDTQDHIECGKEVQLRLTEVIEKLRPAGKQPNEPLPREWYAYTILHDAYVENQLARDIMSKLYISEGTYYRMRRHALRGVTRALLEMGVIA